MFRPLGPVCTAAVGAIAALSVLFVGCAMSAPADLTPDVDPNLPGVDAASDPHPAPGSPGASASDGGDSSGETAPGDSEAKPIAPADAAPIDAAPPIAKPSPGDVLITEVMYETLTPEPASEWIEIYSAASATRTLAGLTLKDGAGRTHLIAQALTIAPGEYLILARNKAGAISAKVPSASIAYEYGTGLSDNAGVLLANGASGGIELLNGSVSITAAPYGGWFTQSGGNSIQLKALDASQSNAKAGWCLSATAWTTGSGKGTPSAAADCP